MDIIPAFDKEYTVSGPSHSVVRCWHSSSETLGLSPSQLRLDFTTCYICKFNFLFLDTSKLVIFLVIIFLSKLIHVTVGLSVDSENIFLVKTDTVVLFLSTKQRAIYQNEHKKSTF